MKKVILASIILAFCLFALISSDNSGVTESQGTIQDFEIRDNPYDDGSGIILSWKPLSREHRVIQYNIYRGISADSLFLLSHIEVDPALGVIGDQLHFYDKDYQVFFDLETAPAKLRKEKQQAPNSPLYQSIPRDVSVLEKLIPHFTVLGAIKNNNFYYKSKKIKSEDEQVYAGYKVHQFDGMYANPMPGNKYYYTVLAVNERGKFLPYADIQVLEPKDDRPDSTAVLHTSHIQDINEWNFEWTPPVNSADIYMWEAWLMPKSTLSLYRSEQEKNSANLYEGNFEAWQKNSIKLFEMPNDLVHTIPVYYKTLYPDSLNIQLPANLDDYRVVLGYSDFSMLKAYCLGNTIRNVASSDKPIIPAFAVQDKNNDKGDGIAISIGKPLAYITQAAFQDKSRRRMLINYELAGNENYKVDKVSFSFYTPEGTKIGTTTEHFIDKIIRYTFPAAFADIKAIDVRINLHFAGSKSYEEAYTSQSLRFEEKFKRFVGGDIMLAEANLSKRYYDFASLTKLDLEYFPGKRTNAMTRLYDDVISYEDVLFKQVFGVDTESRLLALAPSIVIEANLKLGENLSIPHYRDEFEKSLKGMKAEIDSLQTLAAKYEKSSVPDSISSTLEHKNAVYTFISNHPAVIKASQATSDKAWLKALIKERQFNARSLSYIMRVTDGKGLYSVSAPYTDEKGNIWSHPKSEWFDDSKIPTLIGTILLTLIMVYAILMTKRGKDVYIRPIAGLAEIENAIGRATEMGKPVLYVPGWGTLGDVCTIAAMMILHQVAKKTAEFDVRLISPNCDYFVVPLAQEMVKTAYSEIGRPDSYNQNDIYFVSDMQFAFSAAVNGITIRERASTIFYMGYFNAEALLMTETGNQCGAIQIAGTDAVTQIPFFITTCDYTLIGEEFYAASAYLSQDRELVSMLKAQDYFKIIIVLFILIGSILSTLNYNALVNLMPLE